MRTVNICVGYTRTRQSYLQPVHSTDSCSCSSCCTARVMSSVRISADRYSYYCCMILSFVPWRSKCLHPFSLQVLEVTLRGWGDSELRSAEYAAVIPSRPDFCSMYSGACKTARTTYRCIFARCLVCRIMVRALRVADRWRLK